MRRNARALALLGEPNSKRKLEDGTEIYRYVYTKQTTKDAVVFLLLTSYDMMDERSELFVEIKDGVVQSFWRS